MLQKSSASKTSISALALMVSNLKGAVTVLEAKVLGRNEILEKQGEGAEEIYQD